MFRFPDKLFVLFFTLGSIILLGGYLSPAQGTSSGCLDCHTSITNLKKITLELEKSKPKKSSETAGEG